MALVGCAPSATDTRPEITLINAPGEDRVGLEAGLRRDPASRPYRFTSGPGVRFQETHRDMLGSGAPRYTREVFSYRTVLGEVRELDMSVRDFHRRPRDGRDSLYLSLGRLLHYPDRTRRESLVEKAEDPNLKRLRRRALDDVVVPLPTELAILTLP